MKKNITKALTELNKAEKKLLHDTKKNSAFQNKIYDKIPPNLRTTLETAFIKAFELVFTRGTAIIEKTFHKDEMILEHGVKNELIEQQDGRKNIKRLDKTAQKSNLLNNTIATTAGMGLGLLGCGLPDIPIFVSTILKGLYQIALSYGFSYENTEEKIYILRLIKVALADADSKESYNAQLDCMSYDDTTLKQEIAATAQVLSDQLLVEKFIQGIPLVGIVGGATNHAVYQKISKLAVVKYKKRYLLQKLS